MLVSGLTTARRRTYNIIPWYMVPVGLTTACHGAVDVVSPHLLMQKTKNGIMLYVSLIAVLHIIYQVYVYHTWYVQPGITEARMMCCTTLYQVACGIM